MKALIYLFFLVVFANLPLAAQQITITHVSAEGERNVYFIKLLELALEKSKAPTEQFHLQALPYLHQGRAIRLLKASKELEVLWTMTDAAREEVLLPIRIPLLKGLMGYRIFIIRQEDQVKFRDINTLAQLRKLIAGQGHDWPDTQILRANKLKVTTSSSYIGLFEMLQSKRFDYFPRSITEAQSEQPLYQPKGLITEDSLLLHYIAPFYFFVALANTTLAKRLETGLQIALEDGSFDILLNSYFLDQAGPDWLKDKKVLHLKNPLLPPLTPVDNEQLWYR